MKKIENLVNLLLNKDKEIALIIEDLSDSERIELRNAAIASGVKELPRNLYFNYTTQIWIE